MGNFGDTDSDSDNDSREKQLAPVDTCEMLVHLFCNAVAVSLVLAAQYTPYVNSREFTTGFQSTCYHRNNTGEICHSTTITNSCIVFSIAAILHLICMTSAVPVFVFNVLRYQKCFEAWCILYFLRYVKFKRGLIYFAIFSGLLSAVLLIMLVAGAGCMSNCGDNFCSDSAADVGPAVILLFVSALFFGLTRYLTPKNFHRLKIVTSSDDEDEDDNNNNFAANNNNNNNNNAPNNNTDNTSGNNHWSNHHHYPSLARTYVLGGGELNVVPSPTVVPTNNNSIVNNASPNIASAAPPPAFYNEGSSNPFFHNQT